MHTSTLQFQLYRTLLYATVFCTGAAVLVIEVAAVRMLAIYFGNSLYVLSSILSLILAALALGYFFGGRLADRLPTHRPLYTIIATAGVALLLVQSLSIAAFPTLSTQVSILSGPLLLGGFFFIPALLLGIDSPYVVKLLSTHTVGPDQSGKIAGTTFFLSTLGSIAGSILTGFVFIPELGTQTTISMTASVLLLIGVAGYLSFEYLEQRSLSWTLCSPAMALLLSAGVLILVWNHSNTAQAANEIYATDGYYSHIAIADTDSPHGTVRTMRLDSSHASSIFLDPELRAYHPFLYAQYAGLYPELVPNATRFLLIGGGGYTIPRHLLHADPAIQIEVVEPEPALQDIAHEYLDLPETDRLTTHTADGRAFVRNYSGDPYDVIFANAMQTGLSVPAHLVTAEYFSQVQDVLADDGIFMLNVIGSLRDTSPSLLGSITKTMEATFPTVALYKVHNRAADRDAIDNFIFVARTNTEEAHFTTSQVHDYDLSYHPAQAHAITLPYKDLTHERVFTDDTATAIERLLIEEYHDF